MNRTYLSHGIWAVTALLAFVFGSKMGSDSSSLTAGDHDSTGLHFYGDEDDGRLSALPDPSGDKASESISGDAELVAAGVVVMLSDARIAELGEMALKSPNPIERRRAFDQLLQGMTAENALAIREQIKSLPQEGSEFRDFHYAWGAIAGGAAVLHGQESEEHDMAVTLAGWAGADSGAAMAWFKGLTEDEANGGDLKSGLVHGLADSDPMAAARFVYELGQAGDQQAEGLLSVVASEVLRMGGAEEASRWSESLPEGPLRAAAMDRVANGFVAEDPVAAAAWAERFAGQPESARVIEEVGDEWAERDPLAAVNWLETLDSGAGQAQGLQSAFGEWVKRDPRAASEHLVAMNDSPARDSAIGGFVRRLAYEDPQSAIAWAGEISDAGARERTLVRAGQAMLRRDATGTREWLATSGLSAEAQKQVLNPPQRSRSRGRR
jgi:hypothetical protein